MACEEYACETFRSECACGKGFLRYYRRYLYNDWGHKQVYNTPIETVCDYCKNRYHYEEDDLEVYLVPNGLSIPKNPPKYSSGCILNTNEETVSRYSKSELNSMLADMTAPKHRYIKNLKNRNAVWFAEKIWQETGKKALAPIISNLREIIKQYDTIQANCEKKKKNKEKYLHEVALYEKELREIRDRIKKTAFSLYSTQLSSKHEAALKFWDRYNMEHAEEDVVDLEMDITFEKDFTNLFWDTYHITECSDSQYISLKESWQPSKNQLTKKYLCVCSLCGQKEEYAATDFRIKQNYDQTYYPVPCCSCHKVSSFEAKTMDILNHNGISYIREKTFEGLVGDKGKELRFDFALFKNRSAEGTPIIDLIIELQGPHHYEKGYYDEDGNYVADDLSEEEKRKADYRLKRQMRYDQLKQEYCVTQGIRIEQIKHTSTNYTCLEHKIKNILRDNGYEYLSTT